MHLFPGVFTFVREQTCESLPSSSSVQVIYLFVFVFAMQCFISSDGASVTRIQDFPFIDYRISIFRGQQGFEALASCPNNDSFHDHHLPACNDLSVATTSHPPQV